MNLYDKYKGRLPLEDLQGLMNNPVPLTLRVNTLKITKLDLKQKLTKRGFELTDHPVHEQALMIVKEPFSIGATPEYLAGYYILQDASSMISVSELRLKTGETVLDMAAAPGAKTTHIGELMKNTGAIIACDPDKKRLKSVMYNCERMGIENVVGLNIKAQEASKLGIQFDKILLDAPCSAEGTLHKNPEVIDKDTNYRPIIQEQTSLIESGLKMLKKGGILVYSTCAINPSENEEVIKHAIAQGAKLMKLDTPYGKSGIGLTDTKRFYPHTTSTQGFYIARLTK